MSTEVAIHSHHNHTGCASKHRLHLVRGDEPSHEPDFERRIAQLTDRFHEMNTASRFVWLANGPHVCDPALDLNVKIEAIRWMLRIAKHMNEPARQAMFLRIENSLRQLEEEVESQARAHESAAAAERSRHTVHA